MRREIVKNPKRLAAYTGVSVFAVVVCVLYYNHHMNELNSPAIYALQDFSTPTEQRAEIRYTVQVSGAVITPGIFEVVPGTRVMDVIEMAEGLMGNADYGRINMVGFVRDGQRVNVPEHAEVIVPIDILAEEPEQININTSSLEELTRLPGIGNQTAINILFHRQQNGDFTHINQITNVSGIGTATLNRIAPFITVE